MDLMGPLTRHQPDLPGHRAVLAGLGGGITIAVLGVLGSIGDATILIAAFGASCVLVFTVPDSHFSQPVNVIGGHVLSAICGVIVAKVLPVQSWSIGLAVGLSITMMAALRVTHPPAGGNPIALMLNGQSWSFVLTPVLVGAVTVVLVGLVYHRLTGTVYPRPRLQPQPGSIAVPLEPRQRGRGI